MWEVLLRQVLQPEGGAAAHVLRGPGAAVRGVRPGVAPGGRVLRQAAQGAPERSHLPRHFRPLGETGNDGVSPFQQPEILASGREQPPRGGDRPHFRRADAQRRLPSRRRQRAGHGHVPAVPSTGGRGRDAAEADGRGGRKWQQEAGDSVAGSHAQGRQAPLRVSGPVAAGGLDPAPGGGACSLSACARA